VTPIRDERGTVTAFVAIMTVTMLVVAGLVIDGGYTLAARRRAFNEANAAARAAAQTIDESALRTTGIVQLRPYDAQRVAEQHLRDAGMTGTVTVGATTVTVHAITTQPMAILGIIGIGPLKIEADGTARAVQGVQAGDQP
jgi:Flp pilus assembly protein TadG